MTAVGETPHPALTTALDERIEGCELEITGRLTAASNATFLTEVRTADEVLQCVYKPTQGERPLWDFPEHTLSLREVAAYQVSQLGGFDVVPVTVLVEGPLGPGSLQLWVEEEPDVTERVVDLVPSHSLPRKGWFDVIEGMGRGDEPVSVVHADDPRLRMMAVFDALINNADRKGGHILGSGDHVFGIDHGIGFHIEPKLRTLLWGWSGKRLRNVELERVAATRDGAPDVLDGLLSEIEIVALLERADTLISRGTFPVDHGSRRGWPSIPWPPF